MNTTKEPLSSQQLTNKIKEHIEELAQATDAARVSDEMLKYLDMCSRFHTYSWCNTWLILLACPHATQVAGFRKWQSMNRFVRKGEHGIPILAPIVIAQKDKDTNDPAKTLAGFKTVYVFDVSQTDGEPLPEPPNWTTPEKKVELQEGLIAFAKDKGITVTEKELGGNIQGVSKGGAIELSATAGTSTLIHEIAHELLHKKECQWTMTREEKELEAEAVAFVVARHFNLDTSTSANYIAFWNGGKDAINEHLERIQNTAKLIIDALEGI